MAAISKLTNGCSQYGASMGRRDTRPDDTAASIKFHLVRVHLDSGGYDSGGAYWGYGAPLYRAEGDGPEQVEEMFTRAYDRENAKEKVRAKFPNARFYR